jgi:hypothetical protein
VEILPGLTSTARENIEPFARDLARSDVRAIALFPTALNVSERRTLYHSLEAIEGLKIPHVHLRTDMDGGEMEYLVDRYGTEVFNIHPRGSRHPFGAVPRAFRERVFVENSNCPIEDEELEAAAGICPDYSHLESARLLGWTDYAETTLRQLDRFLIGCCHVSAIRIGDRNSWSGGSDHHRYVQLTDLDYMARYRGLVPDRWLSLELENTLEEQLRAADYLRRILDPVEATAGSSNR